MVLGGESTLALPFFVDLLGQFEEPWLIGLGDLPHELEIEVAIASLLGRLGHLAKGQIGLNLGCLDNKAIFLELC